jgi:hypothetical protein
MHRVAHGLASLTSFSRSDRPSTGDVKQQTAGIAGVAQGQDMRMPQRRST